SIDGSGSSMSYVSGSAGSSICSTNPASTIARYSGRERAHEGLLDAHVRGGERCLEILDVLRDLRVADIRDGAGADDALRGPFPAEVRVELGELRALAGLLRHPRRLALLHLAALEPGETAP